MPDPLAPPFTALQGLVQLVDLLQGFQQAAARGSLAEQFGVTGPATSGAEPLVRAVHARFADAGQALLKAADAAPTGEQRRQRRDAVYAAAAVVDEALALDIDWPGRDLWPDHLLEHRLFKSRLAGRRFYELARESLQADARQAGERERAAVFLLALQLGFQGRHRGEAGRPHIVTLRQQLHAVATHGRGVKALDRLMVQPYQHRLVTPRDERIAPARPWVRLALGTVATWLLVTAMAWQWLMQPLQRLSG